MYYMLHLSGDYGVENSALENRKKNMMRWYMGEKINSNNPKIDG